VAGAVVPVGTAGRVSAGPVGARSG
jgi:hypothetical protein